MAPVSSGRSAYRLWLDEGYEGTIQDFFRWLQGPMGKQGPPGEKGDAGERGPRGWPGGGGGGLGTALGPGEPNGFEDYTDATLSFDDATRTLTVTGPASVWADGQRFQVSSATFQISDVEGDHFVYFDRDGSLAEIDTFDVGIIREKAFVAYIYWDADNGQAVPGLICETHGATMDGATHEYLHTTNGTAYLGGLDLAAIDIEGNGNDDTSAQFTASAGSIWDEDIKHAFSGRAATDTIPVLWREGPEGVWRMDDAGAYPVLKGADRAYWNEWTGSTWQRTEAASNDYVLAHIWAVPGLNYDAGRFVAMMGQGDYLTRAAARAGALTEFSSLSTGSLPTKEFVAVGTFIFQTVTNYTNAVAARIVTTEAGEDFVDFR